MSRPVLIKSFCVAIAALALATAGFAAAAVDRGHGRDLRVPPSNHTASASLPPGSLLSNVISALGKGKDKNKGQGKESSPFEPPGQPPDRPPDKPGQHNPPNPPGKPPDRPPDNNGG